MRSTMQETPLLVSAIVRHGQRVHGPSRVHTATDAGTVSSTFAEVAQRAERLAAALVRLGVRPGDRVGTFAWNTQRHLEAYLAVPSMGAVLHTLNIRLFPEQLAYVINHGEDSVLLVDGSLIGVLARVKDQLASVRQVVVMGAGDPAPLGDTLDYEALLAAETPGDEWPDLDERSAAAMCYTTGTTGDPKGVVYSHRSTFLHTLGQTSTSCLGMVEADRVLVVVPMFHANAWGIPYAAWLTGSDIVLPGHLLGGEALVRTISEERATLACGVPTIWNDVLAVARERGADLSSLRLVMAGGSATPPAMIEAFASEIGVPLIQGWGMTETSPVAAVGRPPPGASADEARRYLTTAGRVVPGVEVRVAGPDGEILPADGTSVGEFEVRGPWVTASYYKNDEPDRFHHGWLRTGDVGTLDDLGYLQITDRAKDVIKSGGEWISSVALEGEIMAHPEVYEAAVIAVPDARWQERPLACVVRRPGSTLGPAELVEHLVGRVARWWVPERWAFLERLPKTSVGKFDKKALRADHAQGRLAIETVPLPPEG